MTLALTGATGNLGGLAIDELLATGTRPEDVVAIVRNPAKATGLAERGLQVREGSYGDVPALTAALQGVDRLLLISVSGPGASQAHASVIEAAKAAGVGHIVYTSILKADTSTEPLAAEHAATERLLAASGIAHTILRNAWYHENYIFRAPAFVKAGNVVDATGDGKISGAARTDYAAAAAHVLASDDTTTRTHELGGTAFSMAELAQALSEVTGQQIGRRSLNEAECAAELGRMGFDPYSQIFAADDAAVARGDMFTDSTALADLVGRPLIPLVDSLHAQL